MTLSYVSIAIVLITISSCSTLHSDDPASLAFDIPEDSTLILTQELSIDRGNTHVTIQSGKMVDDNDKDDYYLSCRLEYKGFGPRTIEPETCRIRRTEDGYNWVSENAIMRHYTEVYLSSDSTDVIKMVCQQYGSQIDNHFTVADMQDTLGDLVRIEFPQQ